MVRIRVSYNQEYELEKVLKMLKPIISSCKLPKAPNGANKRAYIEIKRIEK